MAFSFRGTTLFATWPQCSADKDEVADRMMDLNDALWCVVAQEEHAEGSKDADHGVHLHAVLRFTKQQNLANALPTFNNLAGQQGHYETSRSWKRTVRYTCKDGDYTVRGDLDVATVLAGGDETMSSRIAKMVNDGADMEAVRAENPGWFMLHMDRLQAYIAYVAHLKLAANLLPWRGVDEAALNALCLSTQDNLTSMHLQERETCLRSIAMWLNENICADRPFKGAQLYLYGPANAGKTTLVRCLSQFLRIYQIPSEVLVVLFLFFFAY